MSMNQYFVAIGLILDIIGVIILAYYKPETFNMVHELSEEDKHHPIWIKNISIFFITIGFLMQLIGNIM